MLNMKFGEINIAKLDNAQKKEVVASDKLMKVTNEALNNPKMLKLYSWEQNFINKICDAKAYAVSMFEEHEVIVGWWVCSSVFWG